MKPYKPLSVITPRVERQNRSTEYRAKAEACCRMADVAFTPLEKQAWIELADDWAALAQEARELCEAR
jgi:hypothetical protein